VHGDWTLDQGLAILFAALTALSNAVAVATQHIASTSGEASLKGWRLVVHLLRQPLWLFGWIALTASLAFQALALHFGPMSEVQPVLVTELVMALLLRRYWLRQSLRAVTWIGAVLTCAGLASFLAATSPSGRANVPTTSSWIMPVLCALVAAAVFAGSAVRGSPSRRAGLFACATGVLWALEATFIKATTDTIASSGYLGCLARWPVYAFVIGGILGLFAEQAALHVGPLKVSQPFIVIVDPLVSIVLGVWLFGERLSGGAAHDAIGVLGFVVMSFGVVLLTQTAPDSMKAEVHRL
jgi:drug/metabolite transporter (DMT)-like permease